MVKINTIKISVFFILTGFGFIFALNKAYSQEEKKETPKTALGVTPAIVELVIEPEKTSESSVTVFNVTNFPLPIKGTVKNFVPKEEIPPNSQNIFDASAWIKIEPSDFILQPLEEKKIKISIAPPKNAEPGGHYATIYFQPLIPEEVLSYQSSHITSRIGVLTLLIVKGDINETITLGNVDYKKFTQYGPKIFTLKFKNEGNVHIAPSGKLIIKNIRGKVTERISMPNKIVLPQTVREVQVERNGRFLLPGKYKIEMALTYGSEKREIKSKPYTFWVFPWFAIFIIAAILTPTVWFMIIKRQRLKLAVQILLGRKVDL